MEEGLRFIAAAFAIGVCGLGTALAQSRIGSAGAGAIAEKPEVTGRIVLLVAIPETIVILGFVIGLAVLVL